jgi:hypothetical protein
MKRTRIQQRKRPREGTTTLEQRPMKRIKIEPRKRPREVSLEDKQDCEPEAKRSRPNEELLLLGSIWVPVSDLKCGATTVRRSARIRAKPIVSYY